MILPPGRSANESSEGCATNVLPPSLLTDMTPVKVPSEFRRCAQIQMRPCESRASSARRYAVDDEVESNTRTGACGIHSVLPFHRHHWKTTSCAVEPKMSGPSYE